MKKLLSTLLFLFLLNPLFGTIYYVDTAADPGGDGTTDATSGANCAWDAIADVNGASFSAGDIIKFKRGCTWVDQLTPPDSGDGGDQITFTDYGEGALPIITLRGSLPGWNTGGNWTQGLGSETVTDGGMEAWDDSNGGNDLTNWTEVTSGTSSVNQQSETDGKVYAGTYACRLDTDASGSNSEINQVITLASETTYKISFYHWETGAVKTAWMLRCAVAGDYNNYYLKADGFFASGQLIFQPDHAGAYTELAMTFTTPDAAGNYQLYFKGGRLDATAQSYYIDATSIKPASDIWSMSVSYNLDGSGLWLSETEYLKAEALVDVDATSRWFWDDTPDLLYVYATENPATAYTDIEGSFTGGDSYALFISDKDYLTFSNLDLQAGRWGVVEARQSNYLVFDACNIGIDCRYKGFVIRGDSNNPSDYGEIKNCTIASGYDFDYDYYTPGISDGIGFSYGVNNWLVHDNTITDWGHSSINLDNSNDSYTTNDNEFYDNILDSSNTSYCRGYQAQGTANDICSGNLFYRNLVRNMTVGCQINGNENELYYNVFHTITSSPAQVGMQGYGIAFQGYLGRVCFDNKAYNNTFYNLAEAAIFLDHSATFETKTGMLIRNNIIIKCGQDAQNGHDNIGILIEDGATVGANTLQNNDVWESGITNVINYKSDGNISVATFNGKSEDGDTIGNNIQSDPSFIDATSADFRLLMGSPCIDAGTDVSLTTDYRGRSIRHAPDMGAYENSTSALFIATFLASIKEKK